MKKACFLTSRIKVEGRINCVFFNTITLVSAGYEYCNCECNTFTTWLQSLVSHKLFYSELQTWREDA